MELSTIKKEISMAIPYYNKRHKQNMWKIYIEKFFEQKTILPSQHHTQQKKCHFDEIDKEVFKSL